MTACRPPELFAPAGISRPPDEGLQPPRQAATTMASSARVSTASVRLVVGDLGPILPPRAFALRDEVEAIKLHDLDPCGDEVAHEPLLGVGTGVDLGNR